ncbi:uncharacterized protein LOC119746432 [Patiria miniata]|uniref:Uncharacterized protein n=1 Tax=Patiria miniata TaxID=46514 RepID=A0A914BT05_PATMI|nr:uncharacterized protein LOC119746432 [Patiria miniata]
MENELLVTTDGSATKLEQEMKSLIASKDKLLTSISEKTTAIANEESRHACLKQDTDVLRKRNQAQLTRLRRQLKEAQLRNKQWHDEACQLENQIEQLRKFTEE